MRILNPKAVTDLSSYPASTGRHGAGAAVWPELIPGPGGGARFSKCEEKRGLTCPPTPVSTQEAGSGLPGQPRVKAEMLSQISCPRVPRASLARVTGLLCPRLSPCQGGSSFPFWGHQTQRPEARALPELVWRAAWWAAGQG